MFFKKSGPEAKEIQKPVLPEKQRNLPKIKQNSPMKVKDSQPNSQTAFMQKLRNRTTAANDEASEEGDRIDMQEIEEALKRQSV